MKLVVDNTKRRPQGVLVWKDGRRESTPHVGGNYVIVPWVRPDGRHIETRFKASDVDAAEWVYVEECETDVSHVWRLSQTRQQVERARELGVALPRYVLQGRHLGETDKEFEERVAILRPAVEGERNA